MISEREMGITYGTKAVGLEFNPSGDETVRRIKQMYADIIDICNDAREKAAKAHQSEKARHFSIAITDAEAAQMRAVKAITFNG